MRLLASPKVLRRRPIRTSTPACQGASPRFGPGRRAICAQMSTSFEEPSIPARVQRPLAAIWVSVGLHLALIALVQVAPPGAGGWGGPVIEARLVAASAPVEATPPPRMPDAMPAQVGSSDLADSLPVEPPAPAPVPPATAKSPAAQAAPEAVDEPPPASPVTLTSAVDLRFYSAREVDVHPQALAAIEPAYPEAAERQKLSGKVVVQLKLEADGRVMDAEVVRSTPPDVFDESTVEAFQQARFAPAFKDGHPVRALMLIEVTFDWAGRSAGLGQ